MSNFESSNIKKPKHDRPLTHEEAREWLRCAEDPIYFMENYAYVQSTQEGGSVLFKPHKFQRKLIETSRKNKMTCSLVPRQQGKTITIAMLFLWYVTFFEHMTVGITSKSNPNVKDVIDRAKFAYENLPSFLQESVTSYNVFNLVFNNGSSIIGETTGPNTFRGRSLNVIFIDEIAHNNPYVVNEMWKSLLPIIDANENQKLIITSTPNGTGDLFSQIVFNARAGRNNFALVELDSDEYPESNDPTFRERKLKEISLNEYLQEYLCVSYDTMVEVMINGTVKKMKIGDLYENL